jgi:hypothetical protein
MPLSCLTSSCFEGRHGGCVILAARTSIVEGITSASQLAPRIQSKLLPDSFDNLMSNPSGGAV